MILPHRSCLALPSIFSRSATDSRGTNAQLAKRCGWPASICSFHGLIAAMHPIHQTRVFVLLHPACHPKIHPRRKISLSAPPICTACRSSSHIGSPDCLVPVGRVRNNTSRRPSRRLARQRRVGQKCWPGQYHGVLRLSTRVWSLAEPSACELFAGACCHRSNLS